MTDKLIREVWNPAEGGEPHYERLLVPSKWRSERRVAVGSDLFDRDTPFEFVASVFGVINYRRHHVFRLLTRRPERIAQFLEWIPQQSRLIECMKTRMALNRFVCGVEDWETEADEDEEEAAFRQRIAGIWYNAKDSLNIPHILYTYMYRGEAKAGKSWHNIGYYPHWPFLNLWIGVPVCDQAEADSLIPQLLLVPAALRCIRIEPHGPIEIKDYLSRYAFGVSKLTGERFIRKDGIYLKKTRDGIDGVICAGGADPIHLDWVRSLRDQCKKAKVRFSFEGVGRKRVGRHLDGETWNQVEETPAL